MRRLKALYILVLVTITINIYSQDVEWEPQKQVTGYIATQAEYIDNLKYSERNYGASVSEAGLLVNYMPLKGLSIKSVFVYRPLSTIDQIISELSAEREILNTNSGFLKLKIGRILTPLSPMNTNFYAPVNVGIALPLMVAHHELYPVNIDGISFNGETGDNLKFKYNVFGGGFRNSLLMSSGPLKFFGNEDSYLLKTNGKNSSFNLESLNSKLSFGGGAHLGVAYSDMVEVGLNYFTHVKGEVVTQIPKYGQLLTDSLKIRRDVFGINLKLNLKGFQLNAEQWWCNVSVNNRVFAPVPSSLSFVELKSDTSAMSSGGYYEIMYTAGKFTPYVKFESHNVNLFDFLNLDYNRYTVGINFKPSYEATIKLEYVHYDYDKPVDGALLSVIYSF
jgi:hypothetical protein